MSDYNPEEIASGFSATALRSTTQLSKMSMDELVSHILLRRTSEPEWDFIKQGRADSKEKRDARERVFKRLAKSKHDLRILTFPSAFWHFEKDLIMYRQRFREGRATVITALERDEAVYRLALNMIPAPATLRYKETHPRATHSVKTDVIGRFHRVDFEDFVKEERGGWRERYNAAWLDFNGPLTLNRARSIVEFLRKHADFRIRLIITVLNGHYDTESFSYVEPFENRFDGLENLMRVAGMKGGTRIEEYAYSQAGAPMLQIGWDVDHDHVRP